MTLIASGGFLARWALQQPAMVADKVSSDLVASMGWDVYVVTSSGALTRMDRWGLPWTVPVDIGTPDAVVVDANDTVTWAAGDSLFRADRWTGRVEQVALPGGVHDLTLVCDGAAGLLDGGRGIAVWTRAGELRVVPLDVAVDGITAGSSCESVGYWTTTETGVVALATGARAETMALESARDVLRVADGAYTIEGKTVRRRDRSGAVTRSWDLPTAHRIGGIVGFTEIAVTTDDGELLVLR